MFKYRKQLNAAGTIYLGQFAAGYASGWAVPALAALQRPSQATLPHPLSPHDAMVIHYIIYLGIVIGPYPIGWISTARGRKAGLLLSAAMSSSGYSMVALADSVRMLRVARALAGIGAAATAVHGLVYLGEITSSQIRGVLTALLPVMTVAGHTAAYLVIPGAAHSVSGWVGVGLCILHVAGIMALPESPVHHTLNGHKTEAKEILTLLNREDDIQESLSLNHTAPTSRTDEWRQLFSLPTNKRSLTICLILTILQQNSGLYAVQKFTGVLSYGYLSETSAIVIAGAVQMVSGCVALIFIDWTGRRPLLIWSTAWCCICLIVLGTYGQSEMKDSGTGIETLTFTFCILYFLSYAIGLSCVPTTLLCEVFTPGVRSLGCTFVSIVRWIVGLSVSALLVPALKVFGEEIPLFLAAMSCFAALIITYFFVPETKGKSLGNIIDMMNK